MTAAALAGRASGSRLSSDMTSASSACGTSGASCDGARAARSATRSAALESCAPDTHAVRSAPSTRARRARTDRCVDRAAAGAATSGAMHGGVPDDLAPRRRKCVSAPKSISLARPSAVQRTLRGLTSRCTSRCACSSASDEATSRRCRHASRNGSGASCCRSLPSSSSIV